MLMHRSLVETGQRALAGGPLVDVIRRVKCFGVCLAPLDCRQVPLAMMVWVAAQALRLLEEVFSS